ncbi:NAD(P)H-hydrate dehydratase [Sphingobium sp.]|uniref:NAD(P)H-hydrate dehydratase n=1 Tax=Sphingobium sp. TaxID=1912891 RepID=UPI003BB68A69
MTRGAPVLTGAQMRDAEQAVFDAGVAPFALMERAGAAAAEVIWRAGGLRDTLVLCGPGNNGGDGFVIARWLRDRGVPVRVAAMADSRTDSARRARAAWDGPVEDMASAAPATQLIDALFGIGLTRGLEDGVAARLCALGAGASRLYAVDVPSGVDADSGAMLSPVPHFDICIALGALKPAHLLQPAAAVMGRLVLAEIGIETSDRVQRLAPPRLEAPVANAHKYTRGLVGVVGGAMAGAAALASVAAARSGAGMVRLLGAGEGVTLASVVQVGTEDATDVARALSDARYRAVLVGPGLGRDDAARARMEAAIGAGHPLVLDADALTLIGQDHIPAGAIVTPHEGEFVALFGALPGSKIDRARDAAARSGAVVVYKGADTVVAGPDGRVAIAGPASSWLSTAGTGDVLAGLAAGRLAVTGDAFRAACEAVWLHGDAARRAGVAFVADDLLAALTAAIAARL